MVTVGKSRSLRFPNVSLALGVNFWNLADQKDEASEVRLQLCYPLQYSVYFVLPLWYSCKIALHFIWQVFDEAQSRNCDGGAEEWNSYTRNHHG